MTTTIPTFTSVEGRLTADPHLQHTQDGAPFVRVRLEAGHKPRHHDGSFVTAGAVPCILLAFGKAAECLARRFRFGDVVVASGRVTEDDPGTFVARRVGHDAARTEYTVTRSRPKRDERARRRRAAVERADRAAAAASAAFTDDDEASHDPTAGGRLPDRATRTA